MERRRFLKQSGLMAASMGISKFIPVAGPFTNADFTEGRVPLDKKLDKKWVQSLYNRGLATTYSKTKNELRYIGMPVGGICCGTVYLGGDGRLWLWDIFNQNQLGAVTKILPIKLDTFDVKEINNIFGTLYLEPATNIRPINQGFALLIQHNDKTIVKRLHQEDWEEVIFEAIYPVATIKYIDHHLPVEVSLQAFSPFIPGDALHSGLPCTIQSITIKNHSDKPINVEIIGWLENKLLLHTAKKETDFNRRNELMKSASCTGILLTCDSKNKALESAPDFGNMAFATTAKNSRSILDGAKMDKETIKNISDLDHLSSDSPVALLSTKHELKPGQSIVQDFIISWFMPNNKLSGDATSQSATVEGVESHFYTSMFNDAAGVTEYIATHFQMLKETTILWKNTWYDSSLPWWFLERTFLNISTLATTVSHRFKSGRFYAWEGVGCCHGTCTHVYQYAQAMSRIFPELERILREQVDLGVGYEESSGMIRIRGEKTGPSIDGQAGTVLRIYREFLMSRDGAILKNNWPKIKKAVSFIMLQDKNHDGMEDTPMENTLDALWSGEISWIVGLCIAGVLAGQKMAEEMKDDEFASICKDYVEKGRKNMEQYLFNGEYFIHRPDSAVGKKEIGSYNTCHIDQVYGQSWAWQVGLGRVLDKEKTMSALRALWKYNYLPDVGPYIKEHTGGRFYALAGEGGMLMNTNPQHDDKPYGEAKAWQVGYFNECMTGFEYQVAGHMMAEGMIEESLILVRTIHDRYHAFKRNPFNEIECSDHYGRAMASYGVFLNACGFYYHGPKGQISFAPKINPSNFKAPFTVAEGWGSYSQKRTAGKFSAQLKMAYGQLALRSFHIELDTKHKADKLEISHDNKTVVGSFVQTDNHCAIQLKEELMIHHGQILSIKII
ncbi:MAG: hypothetical protein JST58_00100 [Bacteroidetes bacterium]|nr:hypothetical protein [Bacteroidota bacterium]